MAAYDPKRPRPSASTPTDDPAPVEALLEPVAPAEPAAPAEPVAPGRPADEVSADEVVVDEVSAGEVAAGEVAAGDGATEGDAPEQPVGDAVGDEPSIDAAPPSGIALNGSATAPAPGLRTSSEVPVAPAPETGTANRAVVIAAVVSSIVALLVVVLLARRRRQG